MVDSPYATKGSKYTFGGCTGTPEKNGSADNFKAKVNGVPTGKLKRGVVTKPLPGKPAVKPEKIPVAVKVLVVPEDVEELSAFISPEKAVPARGGPRLPRRRTLDKT
jgi:hypothetical protein